MAEARLGAELAAAAAGYLGGSDPTGRGASRMTSSARAAYGGNEPMRSTPLQRSLAASVGSIRPGAVDTAKAGAEPYNSSAQSRVALVQLAETADVQAQAPRNSMQDAWLPLDSRAAHRGPQQAAPEQTGSPTNGSPGSLSTSSSSSAGWLSSPGVPWLHDSWRSLWHNAQTVPEVIVLPNLSPPG